ncbi:NAD-dependent epimerase/dehydratase family protein [Candidatus Micrarchaeota archaeon]|nr:NAD-dependent epimerase/dehydratase family protein [Candidatus Micrarchaeota archaeon]
MKCLVTGGAGFIGSNLVDALVARGDAVSVVDDLSTGSKANINPKAVFYRESINNDLAKIFAKENPHTVFHEAAQINVRKSIADPLSDARTNVLGTINLLEACRKADVKKIVYSSSGGACYGEPSGKTDENHLVNPLAPYGASKYAAEKYLFIYSKLYGLDYTILRYANVYGPRQDPKGEAGVIAIFFNKLKSNQPITVNGDGKQTRDYVFVQDVVEANLLAAGKKTGSRIFNAGTGKKTSVNELIDFAQQVSGKKFAQVNYGPAIAGEVKHICLDCSLAKKELGWQAKTSINDGLEKTWEWTNKTTG